VQEVLDVPNEVAAELAAIGDGVLGALRERLGCKINLRGNRLTFEGDDTKVVEAKAVVEELVDLVESGQEIGAGTVDTILNAIDARQFGLVVLEESLDAPPRPLISARLTERVRAALQSAYTPAGQQAGYWFYRPN